jgi:hypothetical protein
VFTEDAKNGHVTEIGIVELARADDVDRAGAAYSVSQAAVAELEAQKRRAEVEKFRAELREANARAREEAMDRPPPASVRAYRQVYGRHSDHRLCGSDGARQGFPRRARRFEALTRAMRSRKSGHLSKRRTRAAIGLDAGQLHGQLIGR